MRLYTSLGTVHSIRKTPREVRYYVEFYTQPSWDRLKYKAYHWYDMQVTKIPGMYKFERALFEVRCWFAERRGVDTIRIMPWFAEQDCKCYELSMKNRTHLETIDLTYEQYVTLHTARYPTLEKPASPSLRANQESQGS